MNNSDAIEEERNLFWSSENHKVLRYTNCGSHCCRMQLQKDDNNAGKK